TGINTVIIRKFYANAVKKNENSPSYKNYIRNIEINFNPPSITKTLKLKTITYNKLNYKNRLHNNNNPDKILKKLYIEE
ncbi:hypothetical protein DF186_24665, partial [Enterococcus hirae]